MCNNPCNHLHLPPAIWIYAVQLVSKLVCSKCPGLHQAQHLVPVQLISSGFLPQKPMHKEEDKIVSAWQELGHIPESEGWEVFVGTPDPGAFLVHAEYSICSVTHLRSGSLCCGEHLRAFARVFNQYFIAIYIHTHPHLPKYFTWHNSILQKSNSSKRKHVSIFVAVISCSVNTWSK